MGQLISMADWVIKVQYIFRNNEDSDLDHNDNVDNDGDNKNSGNTYQFPPPKAAYSPFEETRDSS
jgi:hypothetical protein